MIMAKALVKQCFRPTSVVRSLRELQAGLRDLGCCKETDSETVRYVLKKAIGLQFFLDIFAGDPTRTGKCAGSP